LADIKQERDMIKLVIFKDYSGYCIENKMGARVKQKDQLESHFLVQIRNYGVLDEGSSK